MFPHSFFGVAYFGQHYFPDSSGIPAAVTKRKGGGRRRELYRQGERETVLADKQAIFRALAKDEPATLAGPVLAETVTPETRASLSEAARAAVSAMPAAVQEPASLPIVEADAEFRRRYWQAFMKLATEYVASGMLN